MLNPPKPKNTMEDEDQFLPKDQLKNIVGNKADLFYFFDVESSQIKMKTY